MKNQVFQGKIRSFAFDKFECIEESKGASKSRRIKGYANKNVVDRANERVDPSAFLSSKESFMRNPLMFYNHDWSTPIGKITSIDITTEGLFVEGDIASGFDEAEKVWTMIQQGLLKSFSIGFRTKKILFDVDEDAHIITDLELLEVSVVTIPENADSLFEVAKSGDIKSICVKSPVDDTAWISYKSLISGNYKEDEKHEEVEPKEEFISPTLKIDTTTCVLCNIEKLSLEVGVHPYGKSEYICYDCIGGAFGLNYRQEIDNAYKELADRNLSVKLLTDTLADTNNAYLQLKASYENVITEKILELSKEIQGTLK